MALEMPTSTESPVTFAKEVARPAAASSEEPILPTNDREIVLRPLLLASAANTAGEEHSQEDLCLQVTGKGQPSATRPTPGKPSDIRRFASAPSLPAQALRDCI